MGRERDVLEMCGTKVMKELRSAGGVRPEDSGYIYEISRGFEYASSGCDVCPCLTPSSKIWVFSRWRWLVGLEMMALQGFPADELDLEDISETELMSLAGNAMSVPTVGGFLCLIMALTHFKD